MLSSGMFFRNVRAGCSRRVTIPKIASQPIERRNYRVSDVRELAGPAKLPRDSTRILGRTYMLSCRLPDLRKVNAFGCVVWALGTLMGIESLVRAQSTQNTDRTTTITEAEEIYVARSVREFRIAPTEFCSKTKTGFKSDFFEDQYSLRSTATSTFDGRMVNANIRRIGTGHGCFGRTADPAVLNFYLELHLAKAALTGIGECRRNKSDFPERGLIAWHCFLNLSDPSGRYVGGQLTSNTMTSRKDLGLETDPPGYTQSSIATIRLWKRRAQHQAP